MHTSQRRSIVPLVMAFAFVGASCTGGGAPQPTPTAAVPSGSIAGIQRGAVRFDLLTAQSELTAGRAMFTFGLVDHSSGRLLSGGSPQVWLAKDSTSQASGPFMTTFHQFTAFKDFPNSAPRSPLSGFYTAEVDIPGTGQWVISAVADTGSRRLVGVATVQVADPSKVPAAIGTKALSIPTPVAHTEEEARKICTREPPDPMHYISLDEALGNGKPTVVNFGTPALCESMMCGPVVDEVLEVYTKVGKDRANFIHVEIYPEHDLTKPAPSFLRYGFQSEPWVLIIDKDGVIRARFEGPVVASQVEEALTPLL
jgi:hypothetical protein